MWNYDVTSLYLDILFILEIGVLIRVTATVPMTSTSLITSFDKIPNRAAKQTCNYWQFTLLQVRMLSFNYFR